MKRFLLAVVCIMTFGNAQQPQQAGMHTESVPAPSLAGNRLNDAAVQPALVYLPPSYASSHRRYPVLYLLHGFSLHPVLKDWGEVISASMRNFLREHPDKEFIIVIPNGANAVGGSFYEDSAVAGGWEKWIAHDLVQYVDAHYRTIPERTSRAVAGHSMGGYATLRMLMLHADVFSAGYALSPCCLDFVADFTSSNPEWRKVLALKSLDDIQQAKAKGDFWTVALSAFAISTTPDAASPLLADLPYQLQNGSLVERLEIVEKWRAAMPLNMVHDHAEELKRSSGLGIDYGYEDQFSHIRVGVPALTKRLMDEQILVESAGYHGDHNEGVPARVQNVMLPFIAGHLKFETTAEQPLPSPPSK